MKKWEYKVEETKHDSKFWLEKALKEFSEDGWEVISIVPQIFDSSSCKYIITAKRLIHQQKKKSSSLY